METGYDKIQERALEATLAPPILQTPRKNPWRPASRRSRGVGATRGSRNVIEQPSLGILLHVQPHALHIIKRLIRRQVADHGPI